VAGSPLLVVELMQVTQCRGGRQQGRGLAGREFADQPGERLRPGPSAGAQVIRPRRGQRYQHHPLISRIRPATVFSLAHPPACLAQRGSDPRRPVLALAPLKQLG
jgi:hypothetical protein